MYLDYIHLSWKHRKNIIKFHTFFSLCQYWPRPRAWNFDPWALKFTITKRGPLVHYRHAFSCSQIYISMHRRWISKVPDMFNIWPNPRIWPLTQGAMNFRVYVDDFMDIIIVQIFNLHFCWSREKIF